MTALLTARETAALLRVTPATVYRWAAEGVIPSTAIGGRLMVPAAELEAVIARNTRQAVEAAAPERRVSRAHARQQAPTAFADWLKQKRAEIRQA